MSDTVITAIFTFFASVISAAIVSISNRNKTIKALEEAIRSVNEQSKAQDQEIHAEILMLKQETAGSFELVRKDITTLANRVEKHNGVVDRTYELEKKTELLEEKQRVANHRIEDLERSGK